MNMADTRKPENAQNAPRGRDDERMITTPAIHHVGRTLESDPNYAEDDREGEALSPEAQIANIGAAPDTTMGRSATDLSADVNSKKGLPAGPHGVSSNRCAFGNPGIPAGKLTYTTSAVVSMSSIDTYQARSATDT